MNAELAEHEWDVLKKDIYDRYVFYFNSFIVCKLIDK